MMLGSTMCVGLRVRHRFSTGPSGSSFTWTSGLTGTGFQLQVGSMVISSCSELGGGRMAEELRASCTVPGVALARASGDTYFWM